jgi:putative NADH-flavin reductase
MKLAIFGATGAAGKPLVGQALAAGHQVTAMARTPAAIAAQHGLHVVQCDAADAAAVARAVGEQDAVICAVGPSRGTPAGTVISTAVRNIVAGMKQGGVRRFVFTSGLMVGDARGAGLLLRAGMRVYRMLNGALYRDKLVAERLVRESDLDWVIVRPPVFDGRAARGTFRMAEDLDVGMGAMAAADVAAALLAAAGDDRLLRKAVEVGY